MESEIREDRSPDTEKKIHLQLQRFIDFFRGRYSHDRVSSVVNGTSKLGWTFCMTRKRGLGLAAATVNNHKAHFSLFMGWLHQQVPHLLPEVPTKGRGLKDILLPAPEPRALTEDQVRSLKNICDLLERFHQLKGCRKGRFKKQARSKRDRAI